MLQILFVEKI